MSERMVYPRVVAGLAWNPREVWAADRGRLSLRGALAWQLGVGTVCWLLIALRAQVLVTANPAFAGGGIAAIVALAVFGQLLGFVLYLVVGAWVVLTLAQASAPDLRYRKALQLFSYTTFPFIVGWVLRAVVVWLRPTSGLRGAGDLRALVEGLWAALALRADLGAFASGAGILASALLAALGLFWIWHAVTLWSGLRISFGCSPGMIVAIVATLLAASVTGHLAGLGIGERWSDIVSWSE